MNKYACMIIVIIVFTATVMLLKTFIDIKMLPQNNFVLNDNIELPSQEALEHFQGGLQISTVSNPIYAKTDFDKFDEFIQYLKSTYPLIFSKCEINFINNYNIVIKLKGKNSDLKPNLLTAHYDVVGVKDETKWEYPPFSGHINDNKIISRGTIDDKGSVFAILEALNDLLKNNFTPPPS